ncbi:MAG: HlyC/CorC family transporter [Alphaproteobacteria bacterium]|nr:HlyC/CorC family transporter [Alphaproteobacteria bacterium]
MDPFLLTTIGAIFVMLLLSAFFSGSETALTAASRPRLHHLERSGNQRAVMVNRLRRNRERLLGSILIGNNLVNILASVLATRVLIELSGEAGVVYATIIMTVLVVLFSEVMPKTYAIAHADRMALAVAPAVRMTVILFSPFSRAVVFIVSRIFRLLHIRMTSGHLAPGIVEQELRGAIELHRVTDKEARHEGVMLHSILDLDEVDVGEVMVHRSDVISVNADLPTEEIIDAVVSSPFTRIPLWREKPENIIGVLHAKVLLKAFQEHAADANRDAALDIAALDIAALATPPWFVPESTNLLNQLQAFRQRGEHFAIVVDEYGDLLGIVTLEDILEEIVGDISDEHDIPRRGIRPQTGGTVIVDGDITIRDLNRRFDWQLPDDGAATAAGLVLHESRSIPDTGQVFTFYGFRFEVLGRSGNRLTTLKITPPVDP